MIRFKALSITCFIILGVNFMMNCMYFGLDRLIGQQGESFVFLGLFLFSFFLLYRIVYSHLKEIEK